MTPSQDRPDVQDMLERMTSEAIARAKALVERLARDPNRKTVVSFDRSELVAAIAVEILRAEGVTAMRVPVSEPEKTE